MQNKKNIKIVYISILFLISIPFLVSAYNQNEENSTENYIEYILNVRCEVHGEVMMPLLFPPNIPMFQIYHSENDVELFKTMDDNEQISILRESISKKTEGLELYFEYPDEGTNIVNICYLCSIEEGRSIVKTFHDVIALGNWGDVKFDYHRI